MDQERRSYTLSDADVERIVKAVAATVHHCTFSQRELSTLKSLAQGVSQTQRIASWVIITGIVGTVFGTIWLALKGYLIKVVLNGQMPPN